MLTPQGERARVWGALLLVSFVVLGIGYGISRNVKAEIQHQRHDATILSCQKQNAKHHRLYVELREQREANRRQIEHGILLVAAERNATQRERLVETLEPWQDCEALARRYVR